MWLAIYMTEPFLAYDYLYLGMHQQRGKSFLTTHWYLTAFYVIPWLMLPGIAWMTSAPARSARA